MILQFSQSFFTDALTFINSILLFHHDAAPRQIVGRHLNQHCFARRELEAALPQPTRQMRQDAVPVRQFHPEHPVRQRFHYGAFNFNGIFARHVKISGSDSVINTVCSKWADS